MVPALAWIVFRKQVGDYDLVIEEKNALDAHLTAMSLRGKAAKIAGPFSTREDAFHALEEYHNATNDNQANKYRS